ncbi:hypothetical protein [Nonomuraea sp. NPDC048826]|uniref:hypothetical protein n=1 Tax=Nonomuraea sp. NPDC048826 TaxID=3364347 RepID=UPI00371A1FEC
MNRVERVAQSKIPGPGAASFGPLEHAHPVSPVLYTPVAAFATGYLAAKYVCTFWGGDHLESTALPTDTDLAALSGDDLAAIRRDILRR